MPFFLKEIEVVDKVASHASVLIVICRFCPAASMAARYGGTYLEPLRRGLNTESLEVHVGQLVSRLRERGIRTRVMRGNLRNLVVCMWTSCQRERLRELAADQEALVVMGCRGAFESVCKMVETTACRVYRGMEDEAILAVTPKVHFPLRISLDLFAMTPMQATRDEVDQWCAGATQT